MTTEPSYHSSKCACYKIAPGTKISLTFLYKQWPCSLLPKSPQVIRFYFHVLALLAFHLPLIHLLCKVWQEEITESRLIFLLKSLLDDYCICSSENEVWKHSNICLYKGLIKRDWTTDSTVPQLPPSQAHSSNLATVLSLNLEIPF